MKPTITTVMRLPIEVIYLTVAVLVTGFAWMLLAPLLGEADGAPLDASVVANATPILIAALVALCLASIILLIRSNDAQKKVTRRIMLAYSGGVIILFVSCFILQRYSIELSIGILALSLVFLLWTLWRTATILRKQYIPG
jgi:hypothetical protein